MRIAYVNAVYRKDSPVGGNPHIYQYVTQAAEIGHEIWMSPQSHHPAAHPLPSSRPKLFWMLRHMDVLYERVGHDLPRMARWVLTPLRQIIGSPIVVWEFNTVPEMGRVLGQSEAEIRKTEEGFRCYGRGCDLAICVSQSLGEYARTRLGLRNVLVVPNGSDPDLFKPDAMPVRRVTRKNDCLNVVWIGSANLTWHNFDLLRKTAERLWMRGDEGRVEFHILGPGLDMMREMPPNVHYYGPERYERLPEWLAAMDVGLCIYHPGPADYGSPLKLFDYMASGLTVVGTFQPQVSTVFQEMGQSDLLVPHDDPKVLAMTLLKLAADRERVKQQGQIGRQRVIDHYNWRRAVRDTFKAIEHIKEKQHNIRVS